MKWQHHNNNSNNRRVNSSSQDHDRDSQDRWTAGQDGRSLTQFREIGQVLPKLEKVTGVTLDGASDDWWVAEVGSCTLSTHHIAQTRYVCAAFCPQWPSKPTKCYKISYKLINQGDRRRKTSVSTKHNLILNYGGLCIFRSLSTECTWQKELHSRQSLLLPQCCKYYE